MKAKTIRLLPILLFVSINTTSASEAEERNGQQQRLPLLIRLVLDDNTTLKNIDYVLNQNPCAIHEKDNDGRTALIHACLTKKRDIAQLLIDRNANMLERDDNNCSAYCYSNQQMKEMLADNGYHQRHSRQRYIQKDPNCPSRREFFPQHTNESYFSPPLQFLFATLPNAPSSEQQPNFSLFRLNDSQSNNPQYEEEE